MGWRGYIHAPRKVVFFWSQKAACTSLFTFLAEDVDIPPGDRNFFHTRSDPYPRCLKVIREHGYRSVILARHPMTRSISAYFNKFCVYRDRPLRTRDDLEPFAQDLHDLHCAITGAEPQRNGMTFVQFIDAVEARFARRTNIRHPINGHWESQVPGFLIGPDLQYDTILHTETLERDMTELAAGLGMPYHPRQMNSTKFAQDRHDGPLIDIPACDMTHHAFGYDNFITSDTLARIGQLYAQDFKVFGYPPSPNMNGATLSGLPRVRRKLACVYPFSAPAEADTESGPS